MINLPPTSGNVNLHGYEFDFMPMLHKIILLIKTKLLHLLFASLKDYVYNAQTMWTSRRKKAGAEDLRSTMHL